MSVTEVKQSLGNWSLALAKSTRKDVLDALTYFGHIAIVPGDLNPAEYGDNLLAKARYVGVFRGRDAVDQYTLSGSGMALWLGDEDDKGDIFESPVTFTAASFATVIAGLLPPGGAVTAGTITAVAGTYTGTHRWQTSRQALTYVTDTYSSPSAPVEWRVNPNGTLDAGPVSSLYVTNPKALLIRRAPGRDLQRVVLPGSMALAKDVNDFTTRVVLLAEGEGDAIALGSADAVGVTAKDIHGNTIKFTRLTSEAETSATNAAARAQLMLNRFSTARSAVDLTASAYDIKSDFVVGDYIDVWDPDNGFVDPAREIVWEGERYNPVKLRCVEMTWPIGEGYTIAFRDVNGVWIDLTPWYQPESGDTTIVVGELPSALTGSGGAPIGDRPSGDSSSPATPTFNVPFDSVAYQSAAANDVRAAMLITWNQPLNTDGSTILDGDHYEIRVRATQTFNYQIPWATAGTFDWNQLQTWARPLSSPVVTANQWKTYFVGWGSTQLMINELMVSAEYEVQIRAIDHANPPNQSAWSSSVFHVTRTDTLAPKTPAVPEVAASRIAIQVTHRLGDSGGGTFNLAQDLHHLEVHVGGPDFLPNEGTRVGTLIANSGHINAKIPVVGTFAVENTSDIWVKVIAVDRFGNKSSPSDDVQSSVNLIDSAHISDLTASKITAGTINADLLISGSIKTANSGQRAELNRLGLQLFDSDGNLTVNLTADDATPNFISITDGNQVTVASIDSLGNVQGQVGTFQDVVIGGESYTNDIYPLQPRGLVAFGQITTPFVPALTTTTALGVFQLQFDAVAGRQYQVSMTAWIASGVVGDVCGVLIRDGGDKDVALLTDPQLLAFSHGVNKAGIGESFGGSAMKEFTAGRHQLLFVFYRQTGTGTLSLGVSGTQPVEISIIDCGPTVSNDAVVNDGSGGGSGAPVQTYTKTYNGNWSQTYNGSGSQKSGDTCDQGDFGDSAGNRRSLIGFPYSSIMSDLTGATLVSIKLSLYAEHWYYDAGGTAVIGTHDYTSKPGTWADSRVLQNRTTVANWPKPGKKVLTLSNATFGADFQSGAAKGIALGPGNSSSLTYYGKFSGITAPTTGNRPILTITYTK